MEEVNVRSYGKSERWFYEETYQISTVVFSSKDVISNFQISSVCRLFLCFRREKKKKHQKNPIREAQTFLENCKLWDLPFRSGP